jgi:ascorbate PTS system EIIC component
MLVLKNLLDIVISQFISKPEVLLALVVMLGYILLKKPAGKVLIGGIKTAVGIMILSTGSSFLISNFRPLLTIMQNSLGLEGVIIDPYAGMPAAIQALGQSMNLTGYTLILSFFLNLIYVKFTRLRAVYLTGHVMLQQSIVLTWLVLYTLKLDVVPTVIISAVVLSLYWSILPHLLIKPTATIVSGDRNDWSRQDFTVGHHQMLADLIVYRFGGLFGDPKKDNVEKIKLPKWLSIFQDNVVSTSIIMTIFASAFMLWAGPEAIKAQAGSENWIMYMLFSGLKVAVAITVILTGVRMFIAEIVPSFKGIAEKVLPGAVPAIDCPSVFPFAPKAVILGFMFTVLGQITGVVLLLIFSSPIVIIPGFVPMFFDGATVAVFANSAGGWKAIMVFGILLGLVHVLGAALIFPSTGLEAGWLGMFDFTTIMGGLNWLIHTIGLAF